MSGSFSFQPGKLRGGRAQNANLADIAKVGRKVRFHAVYHSNSVANSKKINKLNLEECRQSRAM